MPQINDDERKLLHELNTRAAVDREFRTRLIADPRSAIKEVSGVDVPDTFKLRFVEKDPDVDALVVLPDFIDASAELSPEELEAVAGGLADNDCWVLSCVTSCGLTCGLVTCGIISRSEVANSVE